jgi:hypothetical protein
MDVPVPSSRRARATLAVGASTVVLTACFVGVLALVRGAVAGFGDRLPIYAVVIGAAFVAALLRAEQRYGPDAPGPGAADGGGFGGGAILTTALGVAVATVVLVSFAGEGVVYALRLPDAVVTSTLFLYFVAAGLIATGLGYWGLRHWREFATGPS